MLWAGGAGSAPSGPTTLFGLNGEDIDQYSIGTPWNASTISYTSDTLSVVRLGYEVRCMFVTADGARLYVTLGTIDECIIDQYDLTTPGDISTGTLVGTFDVVAAEALQVYAVSLSPDGTKLYTGTQGGPVGDVQQWALGTAWDVETATLSNSVELEDM